MSAAESGAPVAASPPGATTHDETIQVVVAKGRTVYLPRSTHPFRGGDTITGKRSAFAELLTLGHVTQVP